MKRITLTVLATAALFSSQVLASPLVNQWAGTGIDADKFYCEYGDGEVKVIYGSQNCPLSN